MKKLGFIIIILSALLLSAPISAGEEEEKNPEKAPHSDKNYPYPISGQYPFASTSFSFFYQWSGYSGQDYSDNYSDIELTLHELYLGGSYAIFPNKLSVSANLSMDIVTGHRSDFIFHHFGLGTTYTFYNIHPVMISFGFDLTLANQSLNKTFSADILGMRPYLVSGINVWRLYFSPYLGVPIYVDLNESNDEIHPCSAGRCFPDRRPDFWYDRNPFGIDYGVPISLQVIGGFFINVEPTGMTWLYPESNTTLWITPGLQYRSILVMNFGVRIRLYSNNPDVATSRRYEFVLNGGITF